MNCEEVREHLLHCGKFQSALLNLEAHSRVLPMAPFTRVLVYYNQPLLYEAVGDTISNRVKPKQIYVLPFPCVEKFCPSFNAKNSLFIDVYKEVVEVCRKQFTYDGCPIPDAFFDYDPISIKCFPVKDSLHF